MNKDTHLIFEVYVDGITRTKNALGENAEEGLLRVRITDYIEDKQEGSIDKNFTINVSLKAFDVKNIVHSFVSHIYGKYDQDRVKGATKAVLDGITDSDVNRDNNRIQLNISEFPGDGMDHYVEAQLLQKEENAEDKGMSDAEYHQARKFGLETDGEEVGKGPIKIQLTKDQALLCTRDGREQEVKFVKGVIFNCDEWVGDYYHCESDKYGGVAVFPPDIKLLSAPKDATTHLSEV